MSDASKPHIYVDLNEVPERWRVFKGACLTVEQVNALVARSYELTNNLASLATARAEFEKTHEAQSGLWMPKLASEREQ